MNNVVTTTGLVASSSLTIRVQSVLYNLALENIERSLEYLDNAALNARRTGFAQCIMVAYGDCSPERTIDDGVLLNLRWRFSNLSTIGYTYFGANIGSAAGHNRLLKEATSDLVLIMNPDLIVSPTLIEEMVIALGRPEVGLVEARQLPIEHPKDYDLVTGETSWASTACAMGPTHLFERLGGFDADTFFLYGDDVDFSWRIRLAGYKVIFQSSATVFHDKRLTDDGGWIAGPAERYYSAEAALLLTYKYSRPDLTKQYIEIFSKSDDEALQKAAMNFEVRRTASRLPTPIDEDHSIAQFIDGGYAHHRFKSR